MLDRSPRRSVANFRDRVGGGSVNMGVIPKWLVVLKETFKLLTTRQRLLFCCVYPIACTATLIALCTTCLFVIAMPTLSAQDMPGGGNPDVMMLLVIFLFLWLPVLTSVASIMLIATVFSPLLCVIDWTKRRYAFVSGIAFQLASLVIAIGFGMLIFYKIQHRFAPTAAMLVPAIANADHERTCDSLQIWV
jgi:hypothetical protein